MHGDWSTVGEWHIARAHSLARRYRANSGQNGQCGRRNGCENEWLGDGAESSAPGSLFEPLTRGKPLLLLHVKINLATSMGLIVRSAGSPKETTMTGNGVTIGPATGELAERNTSGAAGPEPGRGRTPFNQRDGLKFGSANCYPQEASHLR
ncbi:hypothetical protein BCR34DRAFT_393488 [Clohesyomyces aquaticus]|uniref:Uncharacterized protein n=1 Tax=Clohesyomyces aquaticus TaxID=1231657 RepID=A0A1Y1ZE26_9PLEO|nr:hypothetical protein BCR34DRAFT_393488 [Clohesyomyces aquaticus]